MKKYKKLGSTFYFLAVILWLIPIIVYGFYYITFVKMDEFTLQENNLINIATIISSKVDYENNYYIDENFLEGIELANSYNISILNGLGDLVYSSNERFSNLIYSSNEVLAILSGSSKSQKVYNESLLTIYMPIVSDKTSVGVVIVSANLENEILSNVKKETNMITLLLIISLFILTYIFYWILIKPIYRFRDKVVEVTNGHSEVIEDEDNYYEICLIKDNINKMLESINLLEKSRQQFVADVSHELKTPLSSMKVLADAILSQDDAPKEMYDEFMQDISMEVDRENKIINDLLTMVSLDNKEIKLNYELVLINDLVEQVMRLLLPLAKQKNVSLEIKSYRSVEAYIDETKIYLVIMNLIENAIKYNKEDGKVSISIDADFRNFTLKVIDTGIGIPDVQGEKIFERFFRVDKMRSRDSGGTGLGLSIVRKVVIMHGGEINCHSEEGVGTTFIVKLPLSKWENSSNVNK